MAPLGSHVLSPHHPLPTTIALCVVIHEYILGQYILGQFILMLIYDTCISCTAHGIECGAAILYVNVHSHSAPVDINEGE